MQIIIRVLRLPEGLILPSGSSQRVGLQVRAHYWPLLVGMYQVQVEGIITV